MAGELPFRRSLDEVGALPVRLHAQGFVEVLLVTSPETQRWIIPKGWRTPDLAPHEIAAREAREAAGVIGAASVEPFGHFTYDKRLPSGMVLPCRVAVHLVRVNGQLDRWPDRGVRECVWLTSREASRKVCNLSLQRLIARVGRSPELLRPIARRVVTGDGQTGGATPKLA